MLKKSKKIMKADQPLDVDYDPEKGERHPTEFEYLKAKVGALDDIVQRLQRIMKQNDLKAIEEDYAEGDIEDMAWRTLTDEDE